MAAACRILCATMLPVTVAAGLVFRKRIRQTGSIAPGAIAMGPAATAAAAAGALCWSEPQAGSRRQRIDRRGGGSVRVRVHGEDDKIPPIKTVAPDLPLDVLRHIRRACRHTHAGTRTLAHTQLLQSGAAHPPPRRQGDWAEPALGHQAGLASQTKPASEVATVCRSQWLAATMLSR